MKTSLRHRPESIMGLQDDREIIIKVKDIKKAYELEFDKKTEMLFDKMKRDIASQLLATFLMELNINHGFNKEQLQNVKSGVESLFIAMYTGGILGKEFTPQNCIDYLKEQFDIEID